MTEEKKSQLLIRIPESMHKWLKENIKDKTIADFITELINKYKTTLNTEPPARDWQKTYFDLPSNLQSLIITRERIKELGNEDTVLCLEASERIIVSARTHGRTLEEGFFSGYPPEVLEYADALKNLSDEDFIGLSSLFKNHNQVCMERAERRQYHGDPNEIIYGRIRRRDIYNKFHDKRVPLSITQVAGAFGLSYHLAYDHLIPWMRDDGWPIEPEKRRPPQLLFRSKSKRDIKAMEDIRYKNKKRS